MIESSVMDNWMRVELMHSLAESFYLKTRDGKYRDHYKEPKGVLIFDVADYQNITKERCIVGMIIAWSVVTLEALVNHAIAETLQHKLSAVLSIEYPGQITDKIKKGKRAKSELAKKLVILSDDCADPDVIDIADSLADIRNSIVHDKPYEIVDDGNGDFKIEHFRSRGEPGSTHYIFEDLPAIYGKCDTIAKFINRYFNHCAPDGSSVDFSQLTNC